MLIIESKIGTIKQSDERVYGFLTDFNNFKKLFGNKTDNWESTTDSCRFKVKDYPEVGLKIIEKQPFNLVKYAGEGSVPFSFHLWVQLKMKEPNDTKIKITIKADMNLMMKSMAEKPLQMFADLMTDFLCNYHYNY
ncbi:MAG: SRPBCC family protein [Bacteroidia bacterium]|nr:SRPBCC family protein [Bacteroidia bacterium]